jgi:hypothetical protein
MLEGRDDMTKTSFSYGYTNEYHAAPCEAIDAGPPVPEVYREAMKQGAINAGPAPGYPQQDCYALNGGPERRSAQLPGPGKRSEAQRTAARSEARSEALPSVVIGSAPVFSPEQFIPAGPAPTLLDVMSGRAQVSSSRRPADDWGHGPGERRRSLEDFERSRGIGSKDQPPGDLWGHGPGERRRSLEDFERSRG